MAGALFEAMPVLRWDRLGWDEFLVGLQAYRERFSEQSREDYAYLKCRRELLGKSMLVKSAKAKVIVWFCNNWACHLSREAPRVFGTWIRENAEALSALEG